jgi:hypothetical protein
MRIALTKPELATIEGQELLSLILRIATDGKLELHEIVELRRCLRAKLDNSESVSAISYLHDIMTRITSDKVINNDELLELQLAIERVIPSTHRTPILQARKKCEAARRERLKEKRRIEKEKEKALLEEQRAVELARNMRLRHCFAKIAGVSFPNDDGSERQILIERCIPGEQLLLIHDAYNEHSIFTTKVLRMSGEQLGHAPEYMAEKIVEEIEDGYKATGVVTAVTGGTIDKPTRGVNFAVFFYAKDVTDQELQNYAKVVLEEESTYGLIED